MGRQVRPRSAAPPVIDPTQALLGMLAEYDLRPEHIEWDGAVHRFPTPDKPRRKDGWYMAFPDRRGAIFGDHARGIREHWMADRSEEPTPSDRARWAADRETRRKQQEKAQKAATEKVQALWKDAIKDEETVLKHPYLKRKEIDHDVAGQLRVTREAVEFSKGWKLPKGTLLVPMRINRKLVNVQCILADGTKLYWPKAPVIGAAHMVGGKFWNAEEKDRRVYVTEGWATAWSISKATNRPVIVCFSTGGIEPVTKRFMKNYKTADFTIAADNDRWKVLKTREGQDDIPNPGVHFAKQAAKRLKVKYSVPDFNDLTGKPTDYDDLRRQESMEAVERWLDPENAGSAQTVADSERASDHHLGAEQQQSDLDPDNESAELAAKRNEALEVVRRLIADGDYEGSRRELDALDGEDTGPRAALEDLEKATDAKALRRILNRVDPAGNLDVHTDWTGTPPDREWLAGQWMPTGRVTLLSAHGGAAKSLLGLQIAAVVASGEGFRAERTKRPSMLQRAQNAAGKGPLLDGDPGVVVSATWEDEADEFLRRLSWLPDTPSSLRELIKDRLHVVDLAGAGALWGPTENGHRDTVATLTATGVAFEAYCRRVKPRLIVIDPVAAAFGGNENDRGAVRAFLSHLNRLAAEIGAAILLIAHPPKGRDADHYSGSTDWRNGVRALWTLGPETVRGYGGPPKSQSKQRTAQGQALTLEKSNYSRAGRRAWLRFVVEPGEKGRDGPPKKMYWEECGAVDAARAYHKWKGWPEPSRKEDKPPKPSRKEDKPPKSARRSQRDLVASDGKPVA